MRLPDISVKKPVSTAMVFLAVLLFGLVSLKFLPLDIMPNLEFPALTVITVYPGASADEVEEQVSKPLEAVLSGAENLKQISSKSRENVCFIQMQYEWGTNVTEAANNARDIIELVKSRMPSGARPPIIYKINSSMMPIVVYGITAQENYYGLDNIIDEKIAGPIRKVDGVGTVIYLGQPKREIKIKVHPQKLAAYNISIARMATILKAENISIPGGTIKTDKHDFAVQVPGQIENIAELEEIAISSFNGKIIRLKDIAEVEDGFASDDEYARNARGMGAAFMVQKQSGVNTLDVVKSVREKMEEVRADLPADVKVDEVLATDEIITESIGSLTSSFWWALLFVIIVVFAFLREWRSSLIIFLTIPFSLISSFIVMYTIGWTINIFSLMSLIIAIGMVVDNAIVVLENITQHLERGSRPKEAAIFAAGEMGRPIIASTLTTLMVFIPMVFMGGIVGILFKQLAILTSVAMIASLITSLSLTPMMASQVLKGKKNQKKKRKSLLYRLSERNLVALENGYKKVLAWSIKHKSVTIILAVAILIISIFAGKSIGTDFIPNFDAGDVAVVLETEIGTSAAETDRIAQKVLNIIESEVHERIPGTTVSIAGQTNDGALTAVGFDEGKNVATLLCHLSKPDERERTAGEIAEVLRKQIENIPEVVRYRVVGGNILGAAILGNKKPIEINIQGKDLEELNTIAKTIQNQLLTTEGFMDVNSSIDNGKTEFKVHIDKRKASVLGLNTAMVGMQIRQSLYGTEAGSITEKGEDFDINIKYDEHYFDNIDKLKNIRLTNLLGKQVPLSAVADIVEGSGPLEIKRVSQQRIVKVMAELDGISLGDAKTKTENMIAEIDIPSGVDINLGGQVSEQGESFGDLYLVLVLGILLVYMVMAAQFESFKHPFIIMMALPFTLIGIVWAFKLTGLTLSVTTFIGIIMLVGIVVNNGIVLVDYINMLRKRGYTISDAVQESGRSRLRPVLMTSLTTILAMVPMALSKGMGKEMFAPLGVTMIGGLLVSTIITLIIVPTIYTSFHNRTLKKERL